MTRIFADASYLVANLAPSDETHQRAVSIATVIETHVMTTSWVLAEVAAYFLKSPNLRTACSDLFAKFSSDSSVIDVHPDITLFERGRLLFVARSDNEWSLVDCVSLFLMKDHGITDAPTADHHFQQAGFNARLKR